MRRRPIHRRRPSICEFALSARHHILSAPADAAYADARAALEAAGTPIGANDLLIAAQALALDMVLVTDNGREFARVGGLKVETWLR